MGMNQLLAGAGGSGAPVADEAAWLAYWNSAPTTLISGIPATTAAAKNANTQIGDMASPNSARRINGSIGHAAGTAYGGAGQYTQDSTLARVIQLQIPAAYWAQYAAQTYKRV